MIPITSIVAAAPRLPVSVGEVKTAARIDIEDEDALLDAWITEATTFAQKYCGRQFVTATFDAFFDRFPCEADGYGELALELPASPVQSVTSVKYLDSNGTQQTWASTEYRVDTLKGRVVVAYGKTLPVYRVQSGSVVVRFVAGYGDNPGDTPEPIRNWIREQVTYRHMVRTRAMVGSQGLVELPAWMGVEALDFYRVSWL